VNRYKQTSSEVQDYFQHLPNLLERFPYDVSLSYLFARIEQVQNVTLYCGIVKLHQGHSDLTRSVVQQERLTRSAFREKFRIIYGKPITKSIDDKLKEAQGIRDKALHGKAVSDSDMRKAIVRILEFSERFNEYVESLAGFRPFGKLTGYKGRAVSLSKSTTRWILRGMGFNVS
jgi:hypothetical protein